MSTPYLYIQKYDLPGEICEIGVVNLGDFGKGFTLLCVIEDNSIGGGNSEHQPVGKSEQGGQALPRLLRHVLFDVWSFSPPGNLLKFVLDRAESHSHARFQVRQVQNGSEMRKKS